MRPYTQTSFDDRGNCWQYAVASILEVDPSALPDQRDYDRRVVREDGSVEWRGPSYHNALQAYLRKHHGLAYVQLHMVDEVRALLRVQHGGFHLMTGTTPRSATNGGLRHVVVAKDGEMVWDPHPSRAGLTGEIEWAFLVPLPKAWLESEARRPSYTPDPCACPSCRTSDGGATA